MKSRSRNRRTDSSTWCSASLCFRTDFPRTPARSSPSAPIAGAWRRASAASPSASRAGAAASIVSPWLPTITGPSVGRRFASYSRQFSFSSQARNPNTPGGRNCTFVQMKIHANHGPQVGRQVDREMLGDL